jgi:hypothetical protein
MLTAPKVDGFAWPFKNKGNDIVADIYFLATNEARPLLILVDPKQLQNIVGTLKLLETTVTSISPKTCNKATLNSAKNSAITVVTVDKIADILQIKPPINFKTVIHTTGSTHESRTAQLSKAKRVFCADSSAMLQTVKSRYDPPKTPLTSLADAKARAMVALKLSNLLKSTGSGAAAGAVDGQVITSASGAAADLANQISSLKNKLAVLLAGDAISMHVAQGNAADQSAPTGSAPSTGHSAPVRTKDSNKMRRVKMQLLGMLDDGGMAFAGSTGRALAATRWMDGLPGELAGAPWVGVCRMGASVDEASAQARQRVQAGRALVEHFMRKKYIADHSQSQGAQGEVKRTVQVVMTGANGLPRWTSEEEWTCLPTAVRNQLKDSVIAVTGWRPNPHCKDDEEWGGPYGKCCAHNEVAMHFVRPFHPMEVLNTHVCSCRSPAPGNALLSTGGSGGSTEGGRKGFDGCLEFLATQSRWRSRSQTVWDTTSIHHIDSEGRHRAYPKASLLRLSRSCLECVVPNLRMLTVQTEGQVDPLQLLQLMGLYMKIGVGDCALADMCTRSNLGRKKKKGRSNSSSTTSGESDRQEGAAVRSKVQGLVCSYLLHGDPQVWREVSKEISPPEIIWESAEVATTRRAAADSGVRPIGQPPPNNHQI